MSDNLNDPQINMNGHEKTIHPAVKNYTEWPDESGKRRVDTIMNCCEL